MWKDHRISSDQQHRSSILMNQFIDFTGDLPISSVLSSSLGRYSRLLFTSRTVSIHSVGKISSAKKDVWKICREGCSGVIHAVLLGGLFADFIEKKLLIPHRGHSFGYRRCILIILKERKKYQIRLSTVSYCWSSDCTVFQTLSVIPVHPFGGNNPCAMAWEHRELSRSFHF